MGIETKFRVWAENTEFPKGKMYVDGFLLNLNGDLIFPDRKGDFDYSMTFARISFNNINLMQFTGREDSKIDGVEVYDGDIIENCDSKELQIVYYNKQESAWYCRYINDEKRIVSLTDSLGNLNKVIGNIHENPDLL